MVKLPKLKEGDKVAILSPSSAAPGIWPEVYALGLKRLEEVFKLIPVEYPTTVKVGASGTERATDLIAAFENEEIKAIISSIGGDDQVTYIKNLPSEPFVNNPKPFFGFSDNSHFANFLWLHGIPSYYGGALFTQFAMQGEMDAYTFNYLNIALFNEGEFEIRPSEIYNDQGFDWSDVSTLNKKREYWLSEGWIWSQSCKNEVEGLLWGGCLESIDEMLRHNSLIPSLEEFNSVVLMIETSEEIPPADYVYRVLRGLGERGVLERIKGMLVGRAKAWEFDKPYSLEEKSAYKKTQQETIFKILNLYNPNVPLIQNMDFGHTDPQIPMPYGNKVRIDTTHKRIFASF